MPGAESKPSRISVCIINHQGEDRLADTMGAIMEHASGVDEIIVVDSGSDDGSVSFVHDEFPDARVIELSENLGPAVARNRGFEAATHDRILFVDNDIAVEPGCLARLADALDEDLEAVVALPRVCLRASPEVIQFEGADTHYLGLMTLRGAGEPATGAPSATQHAGSMISACFLLDRSRLGEAPPFDETFSFNLEDHDFGVRLRVMDRRILVVPSASCLHGEGTEGYSVRGEMPYPPVRVRQLIRGRWFIVLKTYRLRTLLLLSPVLGLYEALQLALVVRRGWFGEWLQALSWILKNRTMIRRQRRALQATRALPDRDLLREGGLPFRAELPQGRLEGFVLSAFESICDVYWRVIRHAI